jgi:cation:H+ antiporter
MIDSLWINIGIFAVAAFIVAVVGTRMTRTADRLADKTGLGEAVVGAVFLGGSTSLPGIVTSVTAAVSGHPELAVSNAVGGIAAQTVFLAFADIVYKKANLEHAAASAANLSQGTLLITLLSIPLLAQSSPEVSFLAIHPASFVLVAAYAFGLKLVSAAQTDPMWGPKNTAETRLDQPEEDETDQTSLTSLWVQFAFYALLIGVAGYAIGQSGVAIAEETGISESVIGGIFTAISTSLPELVTSVAAVKHGALTLAVGDIIGGNSFDVLFIAFADFAYRGGSIYHAITNSQVFVMTLTILMTGVLLMGLLRREKYGIGNIGFESFLIIMLYTGGFLLVSSGI